MMKEDTIARDNFLSPRKIVVQVLGFLIGLALLAWCIKGAIRGGDWSRIRDADPALLALLIGSTLISLLFNGSIFWITIQPVRRVRFWDMQRINVVGNMLNYAPIRLGALARVLYHMRVDRLSLLQVGAWFAFIGYLLVLGAGACVVATLSYGSIDFIWLGIVLAQVIIGALIGRMLVSVNLFVRYGQGMDQLMRNRASLWGGLTLRMLDLGAYALRMWAAVMILELDLPLAHVIVLGAVALVSSLTPFGRVGVREWSVAQAAGLLALTHEEVSGSLQQLALLESAGEAIVFIPLGAIGLVWYRRKWIEKSRGPKIQRSK